MIRTKSQAMTTKEQNKLSRMILYDQIHRYRAEHKSAQWIAYGLKINPKTVKKYLSISKAEFERNSDSINHRGGGDVHRLCCRTTQDASGYSSGTDARSAERALPGLSGSIVQNHLQLRDEDT